MYKSIFLYSIIEMAFYVLKNILMNLYNMSTSDMICIDINCKYLEGSG